VPYAAVAGELVCDAVSTSAIFIRGFGETQLLVPGANHRTVAWRSSWTDLWTRCERTSHELSVVLEW